MTGGGQRALDVGVSGGLAAFGLMGAVLSWRMENPLQQPIGPGYVPAMVSACLALFALGQLVSGWRRRQDELSDEKGQVEQRPSRSRRSLAAAALIGGSVWVWSVGGYLAGIILAVFGVMAIDRKVNPYRAFAFALILGASLWLLFDVVLKIDLG